MLLFAIGKSDDLDPRIHRESQLACSEVTWWVVAMATVTTRNASIRRVQRAAPCLETGSRYYAFWKLFVVSGFIVEVDSYSYHVRTHTTTIP